MVTMTFTATMAELAQALSWEWREPIAEVGWGALASAIAAPIWLPFARSLRWGRPVADM